MYFFIFKKAGLVNHVIKADTRENAFIRLSALLGYNTAWDHVGASVSIVHCEYKQLQSDSATPSNPQESGDNPPSA